MHFSSDTRDGAIPGNRDDHDLTQGGRKYVSRNCGDRDTLPPASGYFFPEPLISPYPIS
jgi:hypothetical protein